MSPYQGWLDSKVHIESLASAGEGNMNRTLRAQLSDGNSLVLKQSLPYVAKYPDIPAPVERALSEHDFYAAVAGSACADAMPRLIGFAAEEYLLCLEDLGSASDLSTLYVALTGPEEANNIPEELLAALSWLAGLHQLSQPEVSDNNAMRALNHQHIFDIPFQPGNDLGLAEPIFAAKERL